MGAEVYAVSHSANKKEQVKQLGATGFVNISDKESIKKMLYQVSSFFGVFFVSH